MAAFAAVLLRRMVLLPLRVKVAMKLLIALIVAAAVPAGAYAQTPQQLEEVRRRAEVWRICVGASFVLQMDLTQSDPGLTAEMAFQACKTEEDAARNYLARTGRFDPEQLESAIIEMRMKLKTFLVDGAQLAQEKLKRQRAQ